MTRAALNESTVHYNKGKVTRMHTQYSEDKSLIFRSCSSDWLLQMCSYWGSGTVVGKENFSAPADPGTVYVRRVVNVHVCELS